MLVTVEFVGFLQEQAGTGKLLVEGSTLAEVFEQLEMDAPDFAAKYLQAGRLQPGVLVSLNSQRYISDPATRLQMGDTLVFVESSLRDSGNSANQ